MIDWYVMCKDMQYIDDLCYFAYLIASRVSATMLCLLHVFWLLLCLIEVRI